jgi:hypothetical protein
MGCPLPKKKNLFDKTQQDVTQDFTRFLFFFRDEVVIIFYCFRGSQKMVYVNICWGSSYTNGEISINWCLHASLKSQMNKLQND